MLVHKLRVGVLHLSTPDGLRCIPLDRSERLLFLWIFRHFSVLPEILLRERCVRLIHEFLTDRPPQRCSCVHPADHDAVIGTVEVSAPVKRPPQSTPEAVRQQVPVLRPTPIEH